MCTLFFIVVVFYCATFCDGQKLICDGQVVNDVRDFNHIVYFKNLDSTTFDPHDLKKFDPSLKTVVIIHGLPLCNFLTEWVFEMGEKWLKREPVNIILVKWIRSYVNRFYVTSALSTEHIALKITKKIMELAKIYKDKLNTDFHFVGHSLGAHIAGQASRYLQYVGIKVRRVTGLDPAYPCFENTSAILRLCKDDAEFVDVYHSNSGPENKGNMGIYDMIGHVDYYLNGGNYQPTLQNCDDMSVCFMDIAETVRSVFNWFKPDAFEKTMNVYFGVEVGDFVKNAIEYESYCDHAAASYYFIESLEENKPKRWALPTNGPVEVTEELICRHKQCHDNDKNCIEVGINAHLYNESSGAYYVDMFDEEINCNRTVN